MPSDKFIVEVPKHETFNTGIIRIRPPWYDRLFRLKSQTGIPIGRLVEQCIDFALERLEVREEN